MPVKAALRLAAAAAAAALLLATCTAAAAAAAAAPEDEFHPLWRPLGAAPEAERVAFTVAVRLRNLDQLYRHVDEVSDPRHERYGRHMTRDEVNAVTGNPEGVAAVLRWLRRSGVPPSDVSVRDEFVRVAAPSGVASALLGGARFHRFSHLHLANVTAARAPGARVPGHLLEHVDYVDAAVAPDTPMPRAPVTFVDPRKVQQQQQKRGAETEASVPYGYVGPSLLAQGYRIPYDTPVQSTQSTISVYASLGQGFSPYDLQSFQRTLGAMSDTVDSSVGGTACQASDCTEAALDVQYALAAAGGAPSTFWRVANADGFSDYITAVAASNSPPLVHSISYHNLEELGDPSAQKRFCDEVAKLGARGVTVLAATGDDGAPGYPARNNPSRCSPYSTPFPAVCPYVLSVGATMGPETGGPEVAMTTAAGSAASSGGGFSQHFDAPSYQSDAISGYFRSGVQMPPASHYHQGGRGFPDVSAMGNQYIVVLNGAQTATSGTSAATPTWAGMLAQINGMRLAAGKPALGFVNPALYQLAGTSSFFDITQGVNNCVSGGTCCPDGFYAATGWDPITGLGSPAFPSLSKALMSA